MPIGVAGTFAGVWLVRIIPERTWFVLIHAGLLVLTMRLVAGAIS